MSGYPYPPDSVGSSGPYPRHSRSRSPIPRVDYPPIDREYDDRAGFSRGGFAPLPHRHSDLPPPPPPRVYDRDEYDRGRGRDRELPRRELDPEMDDRYERREWDDYDRRARAPIPHWEDEYERPKRRRSPSPLGPPSHRPRVHSPSPPPARFPPNLPDPASIETLLSFRQFAEWFRASHPQTAKNDEEETRRHREMIENGTATEQQAKEKVGMAKRYERYRKEFHSRQLYALFLTHKDSIWFQERYSNTPEYIAFRRRLNRQGRVPLAEKHMEELRSGAWDTVDFDMPESDDKSGSKSRLNDNDEPEGLDRALGDKQDWVGEETLRTEIAPKPKQVFVKTAPPTTSRKELEELFARIPGFQWLAVSEPAQKKSFHRVAWAQYADDVDISEVIQKLDGQKIDGFTFHMSVNSTSTIGRLRVTPDIANSLDRLTQDGERAKALALKLEEELLGDDDEEEDKLEGEGEPAPKPEPLEKKVPGLREKPSDVVEETIGRLLDLQALSGEGLDEEKKIRKAKVIVDQWIAYLRHGLSTCYYCVAPMSFAEELHRKCIGHMRPHPSVKSDTEEVDAAIDANDNAAAETKTEDAPVERAASEEGEEDRELRDSDDRDRDQTTKAAQSEAGVPQQKRTSFFPQKTQEEKWIDGLEVKLRPLLGEVDVVEYGGRDVEAETKKLCAPLIKQEEPSKYRCKDCNKLFRAPEFVIKHIFVKHPEVTKTKLEDIGMLNNYVLDPQHLQPAMSTLAAVDDKLPYSQSLPGVGLGGGNPLMMAVNPAMASSNGGPGGAMFNPQNMNMQGMGMMQQQMMMMMQMQQAMMMGMNMPMGGNQGQGQNQSFGSGGSGGGGLGNLAGASGGAGAGLAARMGGIVGDASRDAAPLPRAPAGGEDPRARRGRVSYQDLDEPGGAGDGGLPY
ncbi:hypothetical protein I317_03046 [Kwoniella heveanensis CBS 569]|nr:hypothetical protein I317_03046 [Kwoniella heveanensis CBS 569]